MERWLPASGPPASWRLWVKRPNIESIAVPPLGCGNGGLEWSAVRPLILEAFSAVPNVRVVLFEPADAPAADPIVDRREKPGMTR